MPEIIVAMVGKEGRWAVAAKDNGTHKTLSRNIGEQASNCRAMWFAIEVGLDLATEPSSIVNCYTDVGRLTGETRFRDRDIDVMGRVYLKLGESKSVFRHKRDIDGYIRIQNVARYALKSQGVWMPNPDDTDGAVALALRTRREDEATKAAKKAAFWDTYNAYLQSPEWQQLRLAVIRRDVTCQRCGQRGSHVHHLTYARIFHEDIDDLQLLCFDCHDIAHNGKLSA